MADATMRFELPLMQVGQSQKEVTHNAALHRIDAFIHLLVESRSVTVPPPAPQIGEIWIVPAGATGTWMGHSGELAEWNGAGWRFAAGRDGTFCVIADEGIVAVHVDGIWNADFLPVGGIRVGDANIFGAPRAAIAEPTGGSVIDAETRAVIGQLLSYLRLQGIIGG